MNILLIYPAEPASSIIEKFLLNEPLGLEAIAAGLEDHTIELLDFRVEDNWRQSLRAMLESFGPQLVGISSLALTASNTLQIFQEIRKWDPEITTVVGGKHPTFMPGDFNHPSIDVIVCGDGDFAFAEIAQKIEGSSDKKRALEDAASIAGVGVQRGGSLCFSGPRQPV